MIKRLCKPSPGFFYFPTLFLCLYILGDHMTNRGSRDVFSSIHVKLCSGQMPTKLAKVRNNAPCRLRYLRPYHLWSIIAHMIYLMICMKSKSQIYAYINLKFISQLIPSDKNGNFKLLTNVYVFQIVMQNISIMLHSHHSYTSENKHQHICWTWIINASLKFRKRSSGERDVLADRGLIPIGTDAHKIYLYSVDKYHIYIAIKCRFKLQSGFGSHMASGYLPSPCNQRAYAVSGYIPTVIDHMIAVCHETLDDRQRQTDWFEPYISSWDKTCIYILF